MDRQKLEQLITEKYAVEPEYPWQSAPSFAVFRHSNNKKWFAYYDNNKRQVGV